MTDDRHEERKGAGVRLADVSDNVSDVYSSERVDAAPIFNAVDVGRALGVAASTVRYWSFGREDHPPVILAADDEGRLLSFRNLCELFVLRELRRAFRVPLGRIRDGIRSIREDTGIAHPLVDQDLLTDGRSIIYERIAARHYNESWHEPLADCASPVLAIDASDGRQPLLPGFQQGLKRVEWDKSRVRRLIPYATLDIDRDRGRLIIDPYHSFGRPCLRSNGTPADVFYPRFMAGDSVEELAEEFFCSVDDVEDAIRFLSPDRCAAA